MNVLKGHCGDTRCVTTRTAQSGANLQNLTSEQLKAELKRQITQLTEDERKELLVAAKAILMMSEEEVAAELERIRARRAEKVGTF